MAKIYYVARLPSRCILTLTLLLGYTIGIDAATPHDHSGICMILQAIIIKTVIVIATVAVSRSM